MPIRRLASILAVSSTTLFLACASPEKAVEDHDHNAHAHAESHGASAAAAPAAGFHCPMHPEVRSDKAGTCSKCGMKLVPDEQ